DLVPGHGLGVRRRCAGRLVDGDGETRELLGGDLRHLSLHVEGWRKCSPVAWTVGDGCRCDTRGVTVHRHRGVYCWRWPGRDDRFASSTPPTFTWEVTTPATTRGRQRTTSAAAVCSGGSSTSRCRIGWTCC